MTVTVKRETPDQLAVLELLAQADARSASLYPAESRHGVPVAALLASVRFFVARRGDLALGCGGFVRIDDNAAEVKRLFVNPSARGLGVGRAIMQAIEAAARTDGVQTMFLETGVKSFEALGLYRNFGFVECDSFGTSGPDPPSVFMVKGLA